MPRKNNNDRRLIEDYLPIEDISTEARREKSVRKGHISTLHLWWARRPLVACRAAVFGALVPAGAATPEFVAELCKYPGAKDTIAKAQRLILEAHAERLSVERGAKITVEDIEAGRAPRPKVLDMFAGGGAIPLEALRLGCEAYALDLNPVAHLIELCTLVYPQKYGQPDPTVKGSAKDGTWAGLAAEVEHWGKWVLEKVRLEIGDLYPPIPSTALRASPDPRPRLHQGMQPPPRGRSSASPDAEPSTRRSSTSPDVEPDATQLTMSGGLAPGGKDDAHMLTPVAYLWTRTVRCKNPDCGGTVPLARQTWLTKKEGRYIALKPDAGTNRDKSAGEKKVIYRVVEATTEEALGFDPAAGGKGGNVACPFCGTVADNAFVKDESNAGRLGTQAMAVICTEGTQRTKIYLSADSINVPFLPGDASVLKRLSEISSDTGLAPPDERMDKNDPTTLAGRGFGFSKWSDLFTSRQQLALLTFAKFVRKVHSSLIADSVEEDRAKAIVTLLAFWVDRIADFNSSLATWKSGGGRGVNHTFARQALPMIWDFAEANPFSEVSSNARDLFAYTIDAIRASIVGDSAACVLRGSATDLPFENILFDAVITDPPYYDNISYAVLSDFFYVWLKRTVGHLYREHFATESVPKKSEAIADIIRHGGTDAARSFYQQIMSTSFREATLRLKHDGTFVVVYAHKTTAGWATLVDSVRQAGLTVMEAWPIDTEMESRSIAMEASALASSIFLVARRREGNETGSHESVVKPELEAIVRERVETLWAKGVTGADLVIACVGAGLRAFTRFARVEYASGEEVPADKFLGEVEGVVLDTLLEKLFGVPRAGVATVDAATRFYVLWRYAYRTVAIDAGEAIVFAYPQGVELDGPKGLSSGQRALVEKQKSKYRLRDFTERGDDDKLGLPSDDAPAPLIDVLHRLLHLMENSPAEIPAFLDEASPNLEQLHLVAQTLAGSALAGNGEGGGKSLVAARGAEASALRKLTTNWRTLIGARRGSLM